MLGIDAGTLKNVTGAIIPEEPMYIILNTAISHRWGMPEPCDVSTCDMCWQCYDCTNPGMYVIVIYLLIGADCQCTLPDGMKECANLPAEMQIDFIRLYQDTDDDTHHTQCSPASHPTSKFIADHADRYADWKPIGPFDTISSMHIIVFAVLVLLLLAIIVWVFAYVQSRCGQVNESREDDVFDPRSPQFMRTPTPRLDKTLSHNSTETSPLMRK